MATRLFRCSMLATLAATGCLDVPPFGGLDLADVGAAEDAFELVVDGDSVYWTTATEVRTCALSACSPASVAAGLTSPHALALTPTEVRFADGDRAYWVARENPGPVTLLIDRAGGRPIADFIHVSANLYYTEGRLSRCNYRPDSRCESDTVLIDEIDGALALDTSGRIWGVDSAGMLHVTSSARTAVAVSWPTPAQIRELVITEAAVFALLDNHDELLAWPVSATTAVEPEVAMSVMTPSAIAREAADLWVGTSQGEVWRRPLLGDAGDAELVVSAGEPIRALAITRDRVVVAFPGHIAAAPR